MVCGTVYLGDSSTVDSEFWELER